MPAPGEQHKAFAASTNPFEEVKPHIGEYTAQEVATLQSRLEKQLGPEYISSRPGAAGQKVHYLAAEKCINLANEVFGFNGWSSGIRDVTVDFIDESQSTGKISLGLSVIVRVTLRDGTYHEDIGYGHIENCKGKAAAFEKAKKEGTTDALKRALRNFGNILGNCIYDKDYLARVTKLKVPPSKWDSDNLHRHAEYAPIKKEPVIDMGDMTISRNNCPNTVEAADDEFGGADFDEVDFGVATSEHRDEVVLDTSVMSAHFDRRTSPVRGGPAHGPQRSNVQTFQQPRLPAPRMQPVHMASANGPQTPTTPSNSNGPQTMRNGLNAQPNYTPMQRPQQVQSNNVNLNRPQGTTSHPQPDPVAGATTFIASHPGLMPSINHFTNGNPPHVSRNSGESEVSVGFVTARAAETLQGTTALPPNVTLFNPHAESPSIRKTPGVDHTKTKPINKDLAGVPAAPNSAQPAMRSNFVNPQADQTRRIGAPGVAASPLQNRGSYRPPQMTKRPGDGIPNQYIRPALTDVTYTSINTPVDNSGGDSKRQKLENGHTTSNNPSTMTG